MLDSRSLALLAVAASILSAGASPGSRFSSEERGLEQVSAVLPLQPGTVWVYRHEHRRAVAPEQPGTVRWTSRVRVTALHSMAAGLLAELETEGAPPAGAVPAGLEVCAEPRTCYFVPRRPEGYVYSLPATAYDRAANALAPEICENLDQRTPEFFFPLQIGLVWAERAREEADRQQAELFAQGQGEAPNPVHYYWSVEGREEVSVPAGAFPGAFVLQYAALDGLERLWFSEGTGIVKRVARRAEDETTSVLVSFAAGSADSTVAAPGLEAAVGGAPAAAGDWPASMSSSSAARPEQRAAPAVVSDRLYYAGGEGNMGAGLTGKFVSPTALEAAFELGQPVGEFGGRSWLLRDILVRASFDALGDAAAWEVSGPRPLVSQYVQRLAAAYEDRSLLYDFSWREIEFRPTAAYEREAAPGEPGQRVDLSLGSTRRLYQVGQSVRLDLVLANHSEAPLTLVLPQGGSERGWRYPHCVLASEGADGRPAELFRPACKTVDPLPEDAFFVLAPGESRALYENGFPLDIHCDLSRPGTYTLSMRYSTAARGEWEWYGAYTEEYWNSRSENDFWRNLEPIVARNRRRLEQVAPLTVTSNRFQIEIASRLMTAEEALARAGEVCAEQGWAADRLHVEDSDYYWDISTNWGSLGMNGFIRLDKRTGKVVEQHMSGP